MKDFTLGPTPYEYERAKFSAPHLSMDTSFLVKAQCLYVSSFIFLTGLVGFIHRNLNQTTIQCEGAMESVILEGYLKTIR